MTARIENIRLPANSSVGDVATLLNAFFLAAGNILIYDINYKRVDTTALSENSLVVHYWTPGTIQYLAVSFATDSVSTADAKAAAYFAAATSQRGMFVLDTTPQLRRSTIKDSYTVVTAPAMASGAQAWQKRMRVVLPAANIAAGATGAASLVTAAGVVAADQITVENIANYQWNAGAPGWAVLDPRTQVWQGLATCC